MHLIFVVKENQYVQPQNPVECQKQHFEIDSKSKKRERHCWDLEEKSRFENKKENNWQIILKLCKQRNVGFSPSLQKIKEIVP